MSIRIDKNLEKSIVDSVIVETTPTTEVWQNSTSETVLNWVAHSHISTFPTDNTELAEYLKYLDAKLSAVRKTATFWDTYNIRESATTVEEFMQKYAALPTNSSLVINTGSLSIGGKLYKRGDIVIKDNFGHEVDVPSTLSGVYVPTQLRSIGNNNLQLTFTYQSVKSADSIGLTIPESAKPTDGSIYSQVIYSKDISEKYEIKAYYKDNKMVIPFWECREYDYDNQIIKDRIIDFIDLNIQGDLLTFVPKSKTIAFVLIIK